MELAWTGNKLQVSELRQDVVLPKDEAGVGVKALWCLQTVRCQQSYKFSARHYDIKFDMCRLYDDNID